MIIIAALLATLFAQDTSKANPKIYQETDNWTIIQDLPSDSCNAQATYESGSKLSWHWFPREEGSYFFYSDKRMASIEDEKKYEVRIDFIGRHTLDDGWGTRTAIGGRDTDGVPQIYFSLKGDEALADMAANNLLGIKYKDKIVASLSLSGSSEAVKIMRRCGADILRNHPKDPFEE